MSDEEYLLKKIAEKDAYILVIISLYILGPLNITKIRRQVLGRGKDVGSRYARSVMLYLKELGLVEEFKISNFRFFRLTEKGKKIARVLMESYGIQI